MAQTKVTVGNSTTKVSDANLDRRFLMLTNDSNESIYIKFGEAAVMNEGIVIVTGGQMKFSGRDFVPEMKGQINGICTSGSKNLCVAEF